MGMAVWAYFLNNLYNNLGEDAHILTLPITIPSITS
jgi:hypothetical protein